MSSPHYRADIDGLRAVAVLPVMLFHAGLSAFGGGFVGVDVFFVISGYLITGIIHDEIDRGTFALARFYERRVRRLFPALALVTLACVPMAWAWLMPVQFAGFARSVVAVNLFVSNILFFTESGYFSADAELKPLLHTWSLAVEEQFYVFFPLLLLVLRRMGRQLLMPALVAVAVTSFALSQWASVEHPSANFYLLPTRAWELAVGAIVAVTAPQWRTAGGFRVEIGAATGLLLIAAAIAAYDRTVPFPGVAALAPVLGTALVIVCSRPSTLVGRGLAWPPLVGIGMISYSAYLWHQPLFAFARVRLLEAVPSWLYLALTLLSLGLAYLTWLLVEQPVRLRLPWPRRRVFVSAALVSTLLIAFGIAGNRTGGFPQRIAADAVAVESWSAERDSAFMNCSFGPGEPFNRSKACVYGDAPASVVIWGDSHGDALTAGLSKKLAREGVGLAQFTSQSCMPALGYEWEFENWTCLAQTRAICDAIVADPRIRTVVLVGRWSFFFEGSRFDNGQGGVERGVANSPVIADQPALDPGEPGYDESLGALIKQTVDGLLAARRRVVLVYPVPEVGWNVPAHLASELQYGIDRPEPLSTSLEVFRRRAGTALDQLDRIGERPGLIRIRPDTLFCNNELPGRCIAERDGQPLYVDDDHVSSIGAEWLADRIVAGMKAAGGLTGAP